MPTLSSARLKGFFIQARLFFCIKIINNNEFEFWFFRLRNKTCQVPCKKHICHSARARQFYFSMRLRKILYFASDKPQYFFLSITYVYFVEVFSKVLWAFHNHYLYFSPLLIRSIICSIKFAANEGTSYLLFLVRVQK